MPRVLLQKVLALPDSPHLPSWLSPLRSTAVRASLWTFGSYGASQVLRLASNLILTRLLLPEAFGLMLIVNLVLQGMQMLSDLGLTPSIVQNKRGEEPEFLRTAWTIQIVRGIALYFIGLLLVYPLSLFFHEPMLLYVLPVITIGIIIDALASTQAAVLNRRLHIGPLVMLDLFSYVLAVIVMVGGAFLSHSVWPLVIGNIVYSISSTIITHTMLGGPRMRLSFNRELALEIIRFGGWLFLSSMLAYAAGQLGNIIIAHHVALSVAGVYSVAFMMSQVLLQVIQRLAAKVLFPLYAQTARDDMTALRPQMRKVRLLLLLGTLPPMWIMVLIAPELIEILYDPPFHDAGWMLQILAIGATIQCVLYPIECVLMSVGDSYRHMLLQTIRTAVLFVCMMAGGHYFGDYGLIMGFAFSSILYYPALVVLVKRYNVWLPELDVPALAATAVVVTGGLFLRYELGFHTFWMTNF